MTIAPAFAAYHRRNAAGRARRGVEVALGRVGQHCCPALVVWLVDLICRPRLNLETPKHDSIHKVSESRRLQGARSCVQTSVGPGRGRGEFEVLHELTVEAVKREQLPELASRWPLGLWC